MKDIEIIGIVAGVFTTWAPMPQILKIVKTKKAHDISLISLFGFLVGILLWFTYGILISSFSIILWNVAALILNLTLIFLKFRYTG